ncbi:MULTISPECIES: FAD-dependent oxidoreductase [Moorena]|uniref:Pyruvate/2-oxoglutarate dehydrogenase complex, dihydrolipoamide dehydrogenase (E3) component n=2 Tax=Moorena TaxID=1155738 RepID=F4Y0D5_9CYAN|nr:MULTISPECIES: FAD-dependent oxidoreductase [Moorena]EGJ29725.1 pyruvate/2-oxoglutarate dehydrogenase complex, dihydrolipoamide dehydrogenase (E3) component [Moorena producens 3L]NEP68146.1 FAD-dependent oxidoreductase [Moorena sp. SIO3A5]NEQ07321.1 FAD-dependent oxidoreductase [Moorena sp. SIO4E2]NER90533.1 FAD-dependent oxidoreductase [Moorena sp. SIO3A2]NET66666.1 FAD-dependent oxidoreductase [Moorena sp. SIO1G6]
MTVDYDLIIIGSTPAGVYAAVAAAGLKARVALVDPQPGQTSWLGQGAIYTRVLSEIGRKLEQMRDAAQWRIYPQIADSTEPDMSQTGFPSLPLTEVMEWANLVVANCSEQNSPAILAALGIDIITGEGEFCRLPHLGFVVNNRRLRSRAYLIATGSRPDISDIKGLQTIDYFTPNDIWHKVLKVGKLKVAGSTSQPSLPKSWVVIGDEPIAPELAQTLVRLGCEVTLVVSTTRILFQEDLEASRLIQAQLEAEGIRVLTDSPVDQVREIEGKTWVQAGNKAIEADAILLATGEQPNVESLNLEGVGIKYTQQGLQLNQKLQTTNPRIYSCGKMAGGYPCGHIAQYQASIALKNALFFPCFKVDYHGIPWTVLTEPQLARVGLTEVEARKRYGKNLWVMREYFKELDQAQLLGQTTGYMKLVVGRNGTILGATIVGSQATELIGEITLAIEQKINLGLLANVYYPYPTLSEIFKKTAIEWQRQRMSRNQTLKNFLEGFFNLRRSWSK